MKILTTKNNQIFSNWQKVIQLNFKASNKIWQAVILASFLGTLGLAPAGTSEVIRSPQSTLTHNPQYSRFVDEKLMKFIVANRISSSGGILEPACKTRLSNFHEAKMNKRIQASDATQVFNECLMRKSGEELSKHFSRATSDGGAPGSLNDYLQCLTEIADAILSVYSERG